MRINKLWDELKIQLEMEKEKVYSLKFVIDWGMHSYIINEGKPAPVSKNFLSIVEKLSRESISTLDKTCPFVHTVSMPDHAWADYEWLEINFS